MMNEAEKKVSDKLRAAKNVIDCTFNDDGYRVLPVSVSDVVAVAEFMEKMSIGPIVYAMELDREGLVDAIEEQDKELTLLLPRPKDKR